MKADYMLVWEHRGGNSPLQRGVLREGVTEKRLLSRVMKNRSSPQAGGGEGRTSRAEVACAKTQKHEMSPRSESSLVTLKQEQWEMKSGGSTDKGATLEAIMVA